MEYMADTGEYVFLNTINTNNYDDFYRWRFLDVSVRTDRLRVTVERPGGVLNEIGIFEAGSMYPIGNLKVIERNEKPRGQGSADNLFDEQQMVPPRSTFMNSTYFDELFERAFGFHDQGHKPLRMGLEVGNRSIIGINLRINEVTGAIALAQTRKLNDILSLLREKKARLKSAIQDIDGLGFRKINDEGECGTLLTLLFKDKQTADKFCEKIGTQTISHSGWHVYNNMEQILDKKTVTDYKCPYVCEAYGGDIEYKAHILPQTDGILERAVNISVGVVDKGLGSGFGINILSTEEEIQETANKIRKIMDEVYQK
jgi:hypothetical protein